MTNLTYNDFNGKFGYGISDGNGGYQLISKAEDISIEAVDENGGGTSIGTTYTIDYAFAPNKTYTIY